MRTAGVVELDPVSDGAGGVLDAFKAMAVNALLLQRPDDALDHTVLLRAMWGDELLPEAVASDQGRVMSAGEDQAIVRPEQERAVDAAEGSKAADQGSSNALEAVVVLPERDRCHPGNARVWQSMTSASIAQPSPPTQTRHMLVDQRWFGAAATDRTASIQGRMPMTRLPRASNP